MHVRRALSGQGHACLLTAGARAHGGGHQVETCCEGFPASLGRLQPVSSAGN